MDSLLMVMKEKEAITATAKAMMSIFVFILECYLKACVSINASFARIICSIYWLNFLLITRREADG